jgi:hypothetical protein
MFKVRWKQSALNELASLWIKENAEQRRAITAATDLIDRLLQVEPSVEGESRPHNRRILFVPPLGVLFKVDSQRAVVRVVQVWRF